LDDEMIFLMVRSVQGSQGLSSAKEYFVFRKGMFGCGIVSLPSGNRGMEMLATILLLVTGTTVASGVAMLCGIKAPIEIDGEW
jgi:hypothetical protein